MTDYDAIIIGAGHNGLICASYLAKAGKNVLVLDARVVPGGCASTREFAPGTIFQTVHNGCHSLIRVSSRISI